MMQLKHLDIVNFKNIAQASLDFCRGLNCFTGANGMGKSNLLEAIHFSCMARATTSVPDASLLKHGENILMVKADFEIAADNRQLVAIGIQRGKGKTLKCNDKEYPRISEHIGRFPIVTIAPADIRLIEDSAQERRRLMDMVLSQSDPVYLKHLINYNKALTSRNSLLRSGVKDSLLYESIESAMQSSAEVIHGSRAKWAEGISPVFSKYCKLVADSRELAELKYKSSLNQLTMSELLNETRSKDLAIGHTTAGIHRDDIELMMDGLNIRRLGSQGQLKTFVIALRFAIFDFLRQNSGITPLLLLDDIFDRLDSQRVENIINLVATDPTFGQIFITDTNRKHIDDIVRGINRPHKLWNVSEGEFIPHGL